MKSLRSLALAVCVVLSTTVAAPCQESGLSRFNPFKSTKSNTRARATVTDDRDSGWSLPKLSLPKLPSMTPASNRSDNSPSTLTKINQNTKQFFSKTKDTLMPWTKDEPAPRVSATGSRRPQQTEKKKPFWSSWFQSEPEPKKITSVTEFLAQPRPGGY